ANLVRIDGLSNVSTTIRAIFSYQTQTPKVVKITCNNTLTVIFLHNFTLTVNIWSPLWRSDGLRPLSCREPQIYKIEENLNIS
uniref:Neur_chan_LBD domain-containing protein n=1 Tax=Ascaris lumbricoides TaxID=6252 RepID=A0A0M3IPE7_ASCLU